MSRRPADDLFPEWERLYLLAVLAERARRGETPKEGEMERLRAAKQAVDDLRQDEAWRSVRGAYELGEWDEDILAFAAAPEAEPRLGWLFRELQVGTGSAFPCPALMRELLAIEGHEAGRFQARLSVQAPLVAHGLVDCDGVDSFHPVRPTRRGLQALLGWAHERSGVPGAIRVEPGQGLSRVVLNPGCARMLQQILLFCTHRRGAEALGVATTSEPIALFAGPSGTGKTLAAEALAAELQRPLFRVDLGLLVSKYVGETEQRINDLFDAASDFDSVLLFDEADALFGKRGEIKEARDRYANMEVSHLLSRIERHHGMCLLTTNLRDQIDSAFLRRFQFIVEFPRPDVPERTRLWEQYLPRGRHGQVDCGRLAEALRLTGAQIESAAHHAAFIAAARGCQIDYAAIADGVWNEFIKSGREARRSSLGFLDGIEPTGSAADGVLQTSAPGRMGLAALKG